ncbi:AAA-ATPase ASD, mitochondrial-like protein [Tanacetum coccineum]
MAMMGMSRLGSKIGTIMFVLAILKDWFPQELGDIKRHLQRLIRYLYPYVTVTFYEYKQVYNFARNGAYIAIERYLNARFSHRAKGLRGSVLNGCKSVFLDMDEYEEAHVVDEGKAISIQRRQRRLYTNTQKAMWTCVIFDHPSTFDTLAMDPKKKEDILNDLITFKKSEDYYRKIGKMWKRGYLLYGPPGTGKSSMIAAMANFLKYDIFDLELTSVEDNTALRKLLIHTSTNSLIVIEDIDCSLDLTGQRTKKKDEVPVKKVDAEGKKKKGSEVTLSGLLNIIDGLWSVCGNERIIVFTTNHVEKLDPALVRSGRMDMHIELSYCCFETFKVLAKNYLDIESHELFATISQLLEETNMTPADVAGKLMPKSPAENAETQESKIDTGKAVNDYLVVTESSETESEVQDDNSRSKTIEQTTSLLANNAYLKAQIREKVFAIAALKNDLRKLKGNNDFENEHLKSKVVDFTTVQNLQVQVEELKSINESLNLLVEELYKARALTELTLRESDEMINAQCKKIRLLEEQSEIVHEVPFNNSSYINWENISIEFKEEIEDNDSSN